MVQFIDTSTGNIDNWDWDFGDGVTSTLKNPDHEYLNPGFFNVNLTVSGKNGTSEETKTGLITVKDGKDPTAGFTSEITNMDNAALIKPGDNINGIQEIMADSLPEVIGVKVGFRDISSSPDDNIISRG